MTVGSVAGAHEFEEGATKVNGQQQMVGGGMPGQSAENNINWVFFF